MRGALHLPRRGAKNCLCYFACAEWPKNDARKLYMKKNSRKKFSVHKHLHTKKCEIFSLFIRTLNVFSKIIGAEHHLKNVNIKKDVDGVTHRDSAEFKMSAGRTAPSPSERCPGQP